VAADQGDIAPIETEAAERLVHEAIGIANREGSGMKLRDCLKVFARVMEARLRDNEWRGGWDVESFGKMLAALDDQRRQLKLSVKHLSQGKAQPGELVRRAADVANYAMIVAELARKQQPSR
jgi:hypothetical protein